MLIMTYHVKNPKEAMINVFGNRVGTISRLNPANWRVVSQLYCHSIGTRVCIASSIERNEAQAYDFTHTSLSEIQDTARRLFDQGAHKVFFVGPGSKKGMISKKSVGWKKTR